MRDTIVLQDHQVIYIENGEPLWFGLVMVGVMNFDMILVQNETEEGAIEELRAYGTVVRVRKMSSMLSTARTLAGMRRELG